MTIAGQLQSIQVYMHDKFEQIDKQFARIKTDIAGLREDMPAIVAETMREVLREQKPN